MLVRYGDLVGEWYSPGEQNDTLVIVAKGAPGLPKPVDPSPYFKAGYDVIIPEYYGYCRSLREFTPMNCIQTILDTKTHFRQGDIKNVYGQEELSVAYENFIVVGGSFGGWVAGMVPKFDKEIRRIGLFYPQLSFADIGQRGVDEETKELFEVMISDGFGPMYRGLDHPDWDKQRRDDLGLTPWNNHKHLADCQVFLAHGSADDVLTSTRTRDFAAILQEQYPAGQFQYAEFYGLGHGGAMSQAAVASFLYWDRQLGNDN